MKVLIAGCGYVGDALARDLAVRGETVWALRRSQKKPVPGVHAIAADVLDPRLGPRLPTVDAVVYSASPDRRSREGYRAAYVRGLTNLLGALATVPRRVVFLSSTSVYGETRGEAVDEETPPDPRDFRGEVLMEGESVLRRLLPAGVGVALRSGGIYGPGRDRLVERVRAGRAVCPEAGPVWTNRIHRDDAAGAIAHLLALPRARAVYLGVDREPASLCEVYRYVARLIGAPAPRRDGSTERGRGSKRCSSGRLVQSGYRFRFPTFREGYRSMLEGTARGDQTDQPD